MYVCMHYVLLLQQLWRRRGRVLLCWRVVIPEYRLPGYPNNATTPLNKSLRFNEPQKRLTGDVPVHVRTNVANRFYCHAENLFYWPIISLYSSWYILAAV